MEDHQETGSTEPHGRGRFNLREEKLGAMLIGVAAVLCLLLVARWAFTAGLQ